MSLDYLDVCNETSSSSPRSLRRFVETALIPEFRARDDSAAGLDTGEIEERLQRFRVIVFAWVTNEVLAAPEKHEFVEQYRFIRGRVSVGDSDRFEPPIWPMDEDLLAHPVISLVGEPFLNITAAHLGPPLHSLYISLVRDMQAVHQGELLKPRQCALRAVRETRQRSCQRLFRPKRRPGPPQKYCSKSCRSTASTRLQHARERIAREKYNPNNSDKILKK